MKILFQGDSITDAGRDRSDSHELGHGYPFYAAQFIKKAMPDADFEFIDLGIGGDQTANLVSRLQSDFIDVQPDVTSILIGINDTWHRAANREWLDNDVFESNYRTVLSAIKEKTNSKILMIEPYLLAVPDKMFFYEDLYGKILICRKLAREFADAYLPLDGLLAAQSIKYEPTHWSDDGVHPNANGSRLIGELYAEALLGIIR